MIDTSEIIISKNHIEPLSEDGFIIYKLGYISPVIDGKREARMIWGNVKSLSESSNNVYFVNQSAHGFSVGNTIRRSSDGWITSQADNRYNSTTIGIVSEIIDENSFKYISSGILPGDYIIGALYFLSPNIAGTIDLLENLSFSKESIIQYIGTGVETGLQIEIDYGHEIVQSNITNTFEYDTSATTWLDDKLMIVTKQTPPTSKWESISCDESGQYAVAGAVPGRLYTTENGGDTWTERQPAGNVDRLWRSVDYNDDASILGVADVGGRLWKSTTHGATWTEMRPVGNVDRNWNVFKMSKTGQFMLAGILYGRIYCSSDFGDTWLEIQPGGDFIFNWFIGDISEDGQTFIIGTNQIGECFFTTDGGTTFENLYEIFGLNDNELLQNVKISSDGLKIVLVIPSVSSNDGQDNFGFLMVTFDGGDTWNAEYEQPSVNYGFRNLAMSRNGDRIAVCSYWGLALSKFTFLGNWTFHKMRVNSNFAASIAISEDSSIIYTCGFSGDIYKIVLSEIVPEAPKNNKLYGRKNGEWVEIIL